MGYGNPLDQSRRSSVKQMNRNTSADRRKREYVNVVYVQFIACDRCGSAVSEGNHIHVLWKSEGGSERAVPQIYGSPDHGTVF